jgi:predicted DNA-binding transcriptional regulator AlpA
VDTGEWTTWPLPGPRGLRYDLHEVAKLLDLSDDTLREMISEGRFPRGYKATRQSQPVWTGAELAAWFLLRDKWHPEPPPADTGRHQPPRADTGRKRGDDNTSG